MIPKSGRARRAAAAALTCVMILYAGFAQSCASLPMPFGSPEGENAETADTDAFEPEITVYPEDTTSEPDPADTEPSGAETTASVPDKRGAAATKAPETEPETTDRTLTPEYQAYAEKFAEKNKQCGWMDAEAARVMFNNAVEAWSWFYLTTAPVYGPYVHESCHQRVNLPGITTYDGLRKYLRNFFTAEITDKIMEVRTDYVEIDGELCAIDASKGSDNHYGDITNYYFHFTGFDTAEFIVTVQHYDDNMNADGTETFTFNLSMDQRPYWHFTTFPIWL